MKTKKLAKTEWPLMGQVVWRKELWDVYWAVPGAVMFNGVRWRLVVGEEALKKIFLQAESVLMWKVGWIRKYELQAYEFEEVSAK